MSICDFFSEVHEELHRVEFAVDRVTPSLVDVFVEYNFF